ISSPASPGDNDGSAMAPVAISPTAIVTASRVRRISPGRDVSSAVLIAKVCREILRFFMQAPPEVDRQQPLPSNLSLPQPSRLSGGAGRTAFCPTALSYPTSSPRAPHPCRRVAEGRWGVRPPGAHL